MVLTRKQLRNLLTLIKKYKEIHGLVDKQKDEKEIRKKRRILWLFGSRK